MWFGSAVAGSNLHNNYINGPSTSIVLVTLTLPVCASFVVAELLLATGASFTELTVIEIVALFDIIRYYRLLCN
jgi:hypothetical protein